ncbi:MAG: prepilin-type N-terminal cleavage/methylation domain-containing protein [Bacilli bacterium]|nr:prepilin-type N-terminal cleavage/methylation domain-containing protein [Bacilli bacterium]MDD4734049.1 prepilin-type N-terminal cleavage/methylation domain-containing protein [Bacilli bacterium]
MSKKGFTLIELLAIIVILAVIALISSPMIIETLENSKISAHMQNEKTMIDVSKKYLAINNFQFPSEIGETIEITLDELRGANLIDKIENPWNKNDCNGYVLVTKIFEQSYDYTPHLNCFKNIERNSDNELLLHYKLNKSSHNLGNELIKNGDFSSNLHWIKGESWNIANGQATSDGTNSSYSSLRQTIPTEIGKTYLISFNLIEIHSGFVKIWLPGDYILGDQINTLGQHEYIKTATAVNEQLFIEISPGFRGTIDNVSVRELTILDSSANNNYGVINNAKLSEDKYGNKNSGFVFNGTSSINTNKNVFWNNTNDISISFWVKPATLSSNLGIIGEKFSSYEWSFYQSGNTLGFVYWNSSGGHTNGMDLKISNVFFVNKWVHVVYVWDKNKSDIFIDGKLAGTKVAVNSLINKTSESPTMIGGNIYTWGDSYFSGNISDVRIYGRVLSNDEVKVLYETTK